jgi:putative inorganic carbon (hco3(-)) transporter
MEGVALPPLFFIRGPSIRNVLCFSMVQAFVFLLYANLPVWIPFFEVLRPAQLAILAGLGFFVIESAVTRRGVRLIWPESYLLLAFLVVSALSSFTAVWPQLALESTLDLARFVIVFFLLTQTVDSPRRMRTVLWTMVVGGLFPALGTLYFYKMGFMSEGRASWLGIFGNANDDAFAMVVLVPIAFALASLSAWWGRLLGGVAVVFFAAAIYTTFSRGGLMGLVAALLVIGMRVRSPLMRGAGLVLLALVLVCATYFWGRSEGGFEELGADATVNQRLITIHAGFLMLADHPLLGVGIGCSAVAFEHYVSASVLTQKALIVHNTFVQGLAETGTLGGGSYLLLILGAFWGAHRLAGRSPMGDPEAHERVTIGGALEASMAGLVVCALSGGYVLSWFPYILFALVAAGRQLAVEAVPPDSLRVAA